MSQDSVQFSMKRVVDLKNTNYNMLADFESFRRRYNVPFKNIGAPSALRYKIFQSTQRGRLRLQKYFKKTPSKISAAI